MSLVSEWKAFSRAKDLCQTVSKRLMLNWKPSNKEIKCLTHLQLFSEGPKTMISDDSSRTTSWKMCFLKWPTVTTKRTKISILILWENLNPNIPGMRTARPIFTRQFWPTKRKFTDFKQTQPNWRNNFKTWNMKKNRLKRFFKSQRKNCPRKSKALKEWLWAISTNW